jgi:hypothetical protein
MSFEDFSGIHKGEDVICIGNGPSLENISVSFLKSRPSFGLNYLPTYNHFLDDFMPTYWLALDRVPMEVIPSLPDTMPKFVPHRQWTALEAEGVTAQNNNVIGFKMGDMDHPGGMGYGTSLLAAAHIASVHMQAKRVFLVGFDCAKAMQSRKPYNKGMTGCPHFYDPEHEPKPMGGWCNMFGILDTWLRNKKNSQIINLSHPTFCKSLEQGFFWEYMEAP